MSGLSSTRGFISLSDVGKNESFASYQLSSPPMFSIPRNELKIQLCTTMMRCRPTPFRVCLGTIIIYIVAICPIYCPGDAWGPPPASPPRIGLASFGTEGSATETSQGEASRKDFLLKSGNLCLGLLLVSTEKAAAAETVGKEPDCDDLTCLGVWDGLLAGEHMKTHQYRKAPT